MGHARETRTQELTWDGKTPLARLWERSYHSRHYGRRVARGFKEEKAKVGGGVASR